MKMEQTDCSETLAYKIQTPGNYPDESIQQYAFPLRIGNFLRNSQSVFTVSGIIILYDSGYKVRFAEGVSNFRMLHESFRVKRMPDYQLLTSLVPF